MDTLDKVKKTAGDVAHRVNEMVHTASEKLTELQEAQRLQSQIRALVREREKCKTEMVNLLMRMFDQNVFAEALLRPDYLRIKELDAAIAALEAEKAAIGVPKPAEEPEAPEALPEMVADVPADTTTETLPLADDTPQ